MKLIVRMSGGAGKVISEHALTKEITTLGRNQGNDVVLVEAKRGVSSHHARIEQEGRSYFVVDLDSKNGTHLNHRRIAPNQRVELKAGDFVSIDIFEIELRAPIESLELTLDRIDPGREAAKLSEELVKLHARLSREPPGARHAALRDALRAAASGWPPEDARTILGQLRSRFDEAGSLPRQGSLPEDLKKKDTDIQRQEALYRAGYSAMAEISKHFLGDAVFESAEEVERFGRLIEQALDATVRWLSKSLQGRKEFETQFGADMTLLMGREVNPLKSISADAKEIGRFLLEWRGTRNLAQSATALEEAFKDLTLHQLGLLSGVQGCLRALLERLDPKTIEKAAQEAATGWGDKLVSKFLLEKLAWQKYVLSHGEMFQENSKLFSELIYPSIRKGYLATHAEAEMHKDKAGPNAE